MIELRKNAAGKLEVPGEPKFGRVYKIVNLMTGEVGYNYTTSDLPALENLDRIEAYDSFRGWVTEIVSAKESYETVKRLNAVRPIEKLDTPHTLLVARVNRRLAEQDAGFIDGYDVLDDMRELRADIMGRGQRPPLDGWRT